MTVLARPPSRSELGSRSTGGAGRQRDLVVLSHLRWTWVWQRPQHLVSRFSADRAASGGHTWFVEEPAFEDVECARLAVEPVDGGLTRVWLVLPHAMDQGGHAGFEAPGAECYSTLLLDLLARTRQAPPDVLLYTPMALELAETLEPHRLFYDVMDDLASFRGAPSGLVLRHRRAVHEATVVFAGGRSLYRSVSSHRDRSTLLVPSGVEASHFARSRDLRSHHCVPVAGYVGVIDERVDLALVNDLAQHLPGWQIAMVGPVAKIDPAELPVAANIEYPGMARYEDLPAIMAGFDVALMPFALNEATKSISPTKTLEYLAAGLPVVSTRVRDVVDDFGSVLTLADDGASFARACVESLQMPTQQRRAEGQRLALRYEWDAIADRMGAAMTAAGTSAAIHEARA